MGSQKTRMLREILMETWCWDIHKERKTLSYANHVIFWLKNPFSGLKGTDKSATTYKHPSSENWPLLGQWNMKAKE